MITTFEQALQYLFSHIPNNDVRKFPGELGKARMKAVMKELGDPQERYKIIHIAGTSGKGSVATLTSYALAKQGFTVGLQLSPHLLDIRERVQISNELISQDKFIAYLNEIIPTIDTVSKSEYGEVTYFEILVALAYYAFWKEAVDYAVIETGMGGLYDGTNVVDRSDKLAVITRVGFDHMSVLGNTLPEIAAQKAGIIQVGNTVIIGPQEDSAYRILQDAAKKKDAHVVAVQEKDFTIQQVTKKGTVFVDNKRNRKVSLSLIGAHQAENAQIVEEIIYTLSQREGWDLIEKNLDSALLEARLPGRMDIIQTNSSTIIIDGAHNIQKMEAFLTALLQLYPGEKHTFLIAFKHGKDIVSMIQAIEPLAKEILVTDFWVDTQDMLNISEPVDVVASYVKDVPVVTVSGVKKALKTAMAKDNRVVVTGSLYFSSEIYSILANG